MLKIGSTLGDRYTVLHDVGRGGTSHVYLVLNDRAGKQWAAKEVAKSGGGEKGVIKRGLVADVEILKKLRHPNIPSIVDVIETEDMYYILMDYIEGVTLKDVLVAEGPQSQANVVKWAIQICDVFRYLHGQNPKIIYRDTKPSNIMLKPDGNVVLIDFGAAREYKPLKTEDTTNLGSRGYAGPEQYGEIGQTDERTDIYNLGATMYHLVTGHNPSLPPYDLYPIRHWDQELSTGLEQIILKCTKSNPDDRYQSAAELMYALEHYTEYDEGFKQKKKKKLISACVLGAASLLCLAGGLATRSMANKEEASGYDNIIRSAQYATTKESQVELYTQAITLIPDRVSAYTELLDRVFLEDGIYARDEAEAMTKALGATGRGRTDSNEAVLAKNGDYATLAYELGLAYYYYYEGEGNKPMAEPWLISAAESGALSEQKRTRAERLAKIASYYAKLGRKNLAGDAEISYAQYWNDMNALTTGNIVVADNAKTACVSYQELTYQLRMRAAEFKSAGIAENILYEKLDDIESHIANDLSAEEKENYQDLMENIFSNIAQAREAIKIAYHGKEG